MAQLREQVLHQKSPEEPLQTLAIARENEIFIDRVVEGDISNEHMDGPPVTGTLPAIKHVFTPAEFPFDLLEEDVQAEGTFEKESSPVFPPCLYPFPKS